MPKRKVYGTGIALINVTHNFDGLRVLIDSFASNHAIIIAYIVLLLHYKNLYFIDVFEK